MIHPWAVMWAHKTIGLPPQPISCREFRNNVDSCNLPDVDTRDAFYTWSHRCGSSFIECQLDRVFRSFDSLDYWDLVSCFAFPRYHFDHNPILLVMKHHHTIEPHPFRFVSMWPSQPSFKELVTRCWKTPSHDHPFLKAMLKLKILQVSGP